MDINKFVGKKWEELEDSDKEILSMNFKYLDKNTIALTGNKLAIKSTTYSGDKSSFFHPDSDATIYSLEEDKARVLNGSRYDLDGHYYNKEFIMEYINYKYYNNKDYGRAMEAIALLVSNVNWNAEPSQYEKELRHTYTEHLAKICNEMDKDLLRLFYLSPFEDIFEHDTKLGVDIFLDSLNYLVGEEFSNIKNKLFCKINSAISKDILVLKKFKNTTNFDQYKFLLETTGELDITIDFKPVPIKELKVGDKVVANEEIKMYGGSGFFAESHYIPKGKVGYVSCVDGDKCSVDFTASDAATMEPSPYPAPLSGVTPWYVVRNLNQVSLYKDILANILAD